MQLHGKEWRKKYVPKDNKKKEQNLWKILFLIKKKKLIIWVDGYWGLLTVLLH